MYAAQLAYDTDSDYHWTSVRDRRTPPRLVEQRVSRWTRKTETVEEWDLITCTGSTCRAVVLLRECKGVLPRLNLPLDSPIPAQVDAAYVRVLDLAATIAARGGRTYRAAKSVEHAQIVALASQVAVVVHLAKEREAIVHSIDAESLARTAAALNADLHAARQLLAADPIDRALAIR